MKDLILFEEAKTTYKKRNRTNTKLTTSNDVFKYILNLEDFDKLIDEHFFVIYLNRRNSVVAWQKISFGSTVSCIVDLKKIFKTALDCMAQGMILCHNHPSGIPQPSESDKLLTYKVKEAAMLFDIEVLDHIIIGDNNYFSFADEGIK